MSGKKNRLTDPAEQKSDVWNYESGLFKENELSEGEDLCRDDEFICPACCCGIYIEVKEDSD